MTSSEVGQVPVRRLHDGWIIAAIFILLMVAFRIGPIAVVVWLAVLIGGWIWTSRTRRRQLHTKAQARRLGQIDELVAQGIGLDQIRSEALADANANLAAAEVAVKESRFDYETPAEISAFRNRLADYRVTGDADIDAERALALSEESRVCLSRASSARKGNLMRTGAFVVGMFRGD
jgi:hypothetical protein